MFKLIQVTRPLLVKIVDREVNDAEHAKFTINRKFRGLTKRDGETFLVMSEPIDEADELEIMSILEVPAEDYK